MLPAYYQTRYQLNPCHRQLPLTHIYRTSLFPCIQEDTPLVLNLARESLRRRPTQGQEKTIHRDTTSIKGNSNTTQCLSQGKRSPIITYPHIMLTPTIQSLLHPLQSKCIHRASHNHRAPTYSPSRRTNISRPLVPRTQANARYAIMCSSLSISAPSATALYAISITVFSLQSRLHLHL